LQADRRDRAVRKGDDITETLTAVLRDETDWGALRVVKVAKADAYLRKLRRLSGVNGMGVLERPTFIVPPRSETQQAIAG